MTMAKFYIDFACSLYYTEVIEADSKEDAIRIIEGIGESQELDSRMYEGFQRFPILLQNAEFIDAIKANDNLEVTLTKEDIKRMSSERE